MRKPWTWGHPVTTWQGDRETCGKHTCSTRNQTRHLSFFVCICALDLSNTAAWQRIPDIFLCEIGNDRWASSQTRGSKRRGQASRGRVTCSWFHNLRGSSEQRKLLPDVGFSKDSKVKVQLQIRLLVTSLKRTKRLSNVLEKKMCICWSGMKILSEALGKNTLSLAVPISNYFDPVQYLMIIMTVNYVTN